MTTATDEKRSEVNFVTKKDLQKFRNYNRERLRDWLGMWASSSKGKPKTHPDELITREGFGPQFPSGLGLARLESLMSRDIQITDRMLRGVVEELERQRPSSYVNMIPIYFDDYASEGTLERWRTGDLLKNRLRFEMVERTLEWMLDETEKSLLEYDWKRLVVLRPEDTVRTAQDLVRKEQAYAVDTYYKALDEAQCCGHELGWSERKVLGEAMRNTTRKTGYSSRRVEQLRSNLSITVEKAS